MGSILILRSGAVKVKRVVVVSKINSGEAAEIGLKIASRLSSGGIEVSYSGDLAGRAGAGGVPLEASDADMAIVVGGDGTVLRTVQRVGQVPVLGVKVGALGFLCEASPDAWADVADRVVSGRFYLEHRTRLAVSHKGTAYPDVLNEALITTGKPSKILSLSVSKDGEPLHRGRADGVMVSTATGSTAYALSAGGPIIDTQVDVMQVNFICPLAAGLRPMLLPVWSRVEIEARSEGSRAICVLDGQASFEVEAGVPVLIERSSMPAVFVRLGRSDFYRRIREKIKLGFEV